MSTPRQRGPRPLSEILSEMFAARGLTRLRAFTELEEAWAAVVGEPDCQQTKLGEVRRGVLQVTVAHPALLEELAAFRKPELLKALRENAPGTVILDIRFRVGPVGPDPEPEPGPPKPPPSPRRPRTKRPPARD